MSTFEIEFQGSVPEHGLLNIVADDEKQARMFLEDEIDLCYPEMSDIFVTRILEIE